MDKIESQIREADEASRIINSPLFERAFNDVRLSLITALELIPTTRSGDDQASDVRRKLAALSEVKYALTSRIDTGKLARRELTLREKAIAQTRRFLKPLSNSAGER